MCIDIFHTINQIFERIKLIVTWVHIIEFITKHLLNQGRLIISLWPLSDIC